MHDLLNHILSYLLFSPFFGSLIILLIPNRQTLLIKNTALFFSITTFFLSIILFCSFDDKSSHMQFVEMTPWLSFINSSYHVGVDGISILLIMLTTLIMPISILSSYEAIQSRIKEYMFFLLLLETTMLATFVSLDVVLFYFFWEAMLIPMYFLIGIWGGQNRVYAALKFFIYTMLGSVFMLTALIALLFFHKDQFGVYSTNLLDLYRVALPFHANSILNPQSLMFLAFAFAFAIKVPMFPFHTWLPDAHVQAPTAGSVILAAVLLKMGAYGFLRFIIPLFPEALSQFTPYLLILSVIGILYGALVSMVQLDLKKLVAYSSVSHMGFVLLGIFSLNTLALEGSIYQMLNHGISTGALFLLVGILYERRHTKLIADFGGLTKTIPVFSALFMIVTLSSIGLPGTNGFVGEFLILFGSFQTRPIFTILSTSGVILSAVYMLWMFRRVMFGPITQDENKGLKEVSTRELAVLLPLVFLIFWMGIYPKPFFKKMDATIKHYSELYIKSSKTDVAKKGGEK